MRVYALILILLCSGVMWSQEEVPVYHPIDQSDWEKSVEGLQYSEKQEVTKIEPISSTPETTLNFGPILQIIGFIVIAALLLYIIYYFFGKGLFGNPNVNAATSNTITDLEERPMESDLERYLREALANKDYRLAIRIYYLMMLKSLHEQTLITWKKDKTNMDYLIELRAHPQYDTLSRNTLIYEFVWYGDQPIAVNQYESASNSFVQLIQQIQSKG